MKKKNAFRIACIVTHMILIISTDSPPARSMKNLTKGLQRKYKKKEMLARMAYRKISAGKSYSHMREISESNEDNSDRESLPDAREQEEMEGLEGLEELKGLEEIEPMAEQKESRIMKWLRAGKEWVMRHKAVSAAVTGGILSTGLWLFLTHCRQSEKQPVGLMMEQWALPDPYEGTRMHRMIERALKVCNLAISASQRMCPSLRTLIGKEWCLDSRPLFSRCAQSLSSFITDGVLKKIPLRASEKIEKTLQRYASSHRSENPPMAP